MASAVVFDLDGTLVDSESISERAWAETLDLHGYALTPGDIAATTGLSAADTAAYFRRAAELDGDVDLVAESDAVLDGLLRHELAAFPDAVDTVRELAARGIPLAVATSSSRRFLDLELEITELRRYFDAVVSADDVRRGKPAPDVYLEAASRIDIEPADCLAVEDTDIGADAAVAAGMRVLQVRRDGSLSPRHAVVPGLDPSTIQTAMGR